jgi:hypothetical protein
MQIQALTSIEAVSYRPAGRESWSPRGSSLPRCFFHLPEVRQTIHARPSRAVASLRKGPLSAFSELGARSP